MKLCIVNDYSVHDMETQEVIQFYGKEISVGDAENKRMYTCNSDIVITVLNDVLTLYFDDADDCLHVIDMIKNMKKTGTDTDTKYAKQYVIVFETLREAVDTAHEYAQNLHIPIQHHNILVLPDFRIEFINYPIASSRGYRERDVISLIEMDEILKEYLPTVRTYTCDRCCDCARTFSYIGQSENLACQRCVDYSEWLSLGAYIYCLSQGLSDASAAQSARILIEQGKKFTICGELIEE
jgi:hypothetical protein